MRFKLPFFGILAVAAFGAIPAGYGHWTSGQLQTRFQKLTGRVATETIGSWGNHSLEVVHRESDGHAEMHNAKADIMFIESGEADIVIGGRIPDARTTSPGEILGSKIEGGERQTLHPGDIVHVPPRTPHQMLLQPGHRIDYYTVKVVAK